ncbi:MAG: hypothetical protein HY909_12500 [Deltaproteobacteria bacterium]|nr:hypothetical protein [Deltaproteobacteria bacterium]
MLAVDLSPRFSPAPDAPPAPRERSDNRFAALRARALNPERAAAVLGVARQVVADVLYGLPPSSVRRFQARNVVYFDLATAGTQAHAAREAWETVCDRLGLPFASETERVFPDPVGRAGRSRASAPDGAVRVHVRGLSGAEQVRTLTEDTLLQSDDPMKALRDLAREPLYLEHPPTLSAVVAFVSAAPAVLQAEHLAREAVARAWPWRSAHPRISWRFGPRDALLQALPRLSQALLADPEGAAWAPVTRGLFRAEAPGGGGVPAAALEAALALHEAGLAAEDLGPYQVSLLCPEP